MPKLYIISGCNGAGKTTASYTLLPGMLECSEFVNTDEFAKSLYPFDPDRAMIDASRLMLQKTWYLFGRRKDFAIETTLATRALVKMIKKAQEQDYYVTVLYLWLDSPERAISRVRARVSAGGHNIPEETIIRRYHVGLDYFFNLYMNLCDHWIMADNSEPPLSLIAEGGKKGTTVMNEELFSIIRSSMKDVK